MEIMNKKEFYKWLHDDGGSQWKEFSVSEQKFYEDMKLSYTAFIDKYYTDEELEEEIISFSELQEEFQADKTRAAVIASSLKQVLRRRKLNKLK